MINKDIAKILISEEELDATVTRLAGEIDRDYQGADKKLVLLCILKGSIVFMGDLMKHVNVPVEIDFMKVSSYGQGTKNSGEIKIHLDLTRDNLEQYDLLIIEDIVDSGRTLEKLSHLLANRGAHSVKCCTLMDKPSRRQVPLTADFVGMEVPDAFVVGYGLDYNEKYRNLPYVGVLKEEVYTK